MENDLKDTLALVTGANRGIGRAFVESLLARGARVLATARDPDTLGPVVALAPERVRALRLDVTDDAQVAAAAEAAGDLDLLINNAGSLASYSVLDSDLAALRQDMETNFFGTLRMVRAFAPALARRKGRLLNVLTVVSLASMPGIGGYGASKAAAWSMTQSIRAELAAKGVRVHGVYPGPVDTDMIRAFEMDKTPPRQVADAALDGLLAGEEDIAPDPMSRQILAQWRQDPRAVEAMFAAM